MFSEKTELNNCEIADEKLQSVTGGIEDGWTELPKNVSLSLCNCKNFKLKVRMRTFDGMPGGCNQCQYCASFGRDSYCTAGHYPDIFE